jgi:dihydroxy-acid dehydratase
MPGRNLTTLDYAEARAANEASRISETELLDIERNVMPGSGAARCSRPTR